MGGSDRMLRTAKAQWGTVYKLLQAAPEMSGDTRQKVAQAATESRDVLEERRKGTPIDQDPNAEDVEELASVLEEVISESEDSDSRTTAA